MILRFATDLPVPFTNNGAEHSIRPRQSATENVRRLLAHPGRT